MVTKNQIVAYVTYARKPNIYIYTYHVMDYTNAYMIQCKYDTMDNSNAYMMQCIYHVMDMSYKGYIIQWIVLIMPLEVHFERESLEALGAVSWIALNH